MKKLRSFFKPLYDIIPFKGQIFSVIRLFKYKGNLTKYLYFKGKFTFKLEGEKIRMYNHGYQSHIENQVFWKGIEGGWEKYSTRIWIELSKNSSLILDIGANTGIFSILSMGVNKVARVVSFEPIDFIADKFKYNMDLNHFKYELYDCALSNIESKVIVHSESMINSYTIAIDNKNLKNDEEYFELEMKTRRLDNFIEEKNISKIDLMKIDVERHEPMVLEGMGKYLNIMQPDILIEIQSEEIASEIQKLVDGINYLYFNIHDLEGIRQTDKIQKSDYLNYLLCSEKSAKLLGLI